MERNDRNSTTWGEGLVEKLPLEIIGEILARVGARDVIRASLTCSKWREAYRNHLHTLSFNVVDDDRVYRELPTSDLEKLVTKTIVQSPNLRRLSILMDEKHTFSASSAVGWFKFARKNLSELFYKVRTSRPVDVLGIFGSQRLETLSLSDYTIAGVEPNFKQLPCLTSLSLTRARISIEGLNRLLLAFPKLERVELSGISLRHLNNQVSEKVIVMLHCPTLKTLSLSDFQLLDFVMENGSGIDYLHVRRCCFFSFKITGSKILRHFNISYTTIQLLEVEDGDNLESLEITSSDVFESNLFPMKIHTPQLKMFQIWGTNFSLEGKDLVVDLEQLAVCSPQLSHLAIFFDKELSCKFTFGSLHFLEKVGVLEIGWEWDYIDGFFEWTEKVLKCCPNVRKLIVLGMLPKEATVPCPANYLKDFGEYTSSMFEMMRKYQHIEMQFVYKYQVKSPAYA